MVIPRTPPASVQIGDPNLGGDTWDNDVSADGRFVMVDDAEGGEAKPPTIHVVENW